MISARQSDANGGSPTGSAATRADASLWFFEAWRAYFDATGDIAALRDAFPVLSDMIEWHQKGTRYGIGVGPADGLLRAGAAGVQLTWMDAKVGDWVVTPRIGKPVEINALWYNALRIVGAFAGRLSAPDRFSAPAEAAKRSFARFVRPDGEGLFDVIDGPFSLAVYRVTGDVKSAQALLEPMSDALVDQAVGTIGEIFDGDPPHHPRGAPAQAWSVACTLDAWRLLSQAERANHT